MSKFKDDFPNHPGMTQCAMTGRLYVDDTHGIWDDGEWISWAYINEHIDQVELLAAYPAASAETAQAFEALVDAIRRYREATGRHLEIWGELGELYAELKFGVKRHPAYHAGSDGLLNGEPVEIKTLSPSRRGDKVVVKRTGDFRKLIVVKISEDLDFEARLVDRAHLRDSGGSLLSTHWREHPEDTLMAAPTDSRWQRVAGKLQEFNDEE